jgi:CubicO group peptidase (beta-lactamase class C family)
LWGNVTAALGEVDRLLQNESSDMGLAAVVTYGDKIIYRAGYGNALQSATPDFDTTVWRLGSITKVFTALQMFHMVEKRLLSSVDVPITELVPGFQPQGYENASSGAITLGSVAAHVGGIAREVPGPCFSDLSQCDYSTEELLPVLNNMSLLWDPDSRPSYSNLGYSLLGRALASKAGKRYEEYVEQDLLKPLGMASSGFTWTDAALANLARGAYPDRPITHLGWAAPSGDLFTTAADMAKFLLLLTGSGPSLLSAWRLRQWAQPKFLLPDGLGGYGMPWEIERISGRWLLTKSGDIDQFSSFMAHDPTANFAVWVQSNKPQSMPTLGPQVAAILAEGFSSTILGSESCPQQLLPSNPGQYTGSYMAYVPALLANMTITVQTQTPSGCTRSGLSAFFDWGAGALPASLIPTQATDTTKELTIQLPPSLPISCIFATELGWTGHSMAFEPATGTVTLPGLLTHVTFVRVSG